MSDLDLRRRPRIPSFLSDGLWQFCVTLCVLLITSRVATAAPIILRNVESFSLVADPLMIHLGAGPVSTGPITISLLGDQLSFVRFDLGTRIRELDLHLRLDAPLLVIAAPELSTVSLVILGLAGVFGVVRMSRKR